MLIGTKNNQLSVETLIEEIISSKFQERGKLSLLKATTRPCGFQLDKYLDNSADSLK